MKLIAFFVLAAALSFVQDRPLDNNEARAPRARRDKNARKFLTGFCAAYVPIAYAHLIEELS